MPDQMGEMDYRQGAFERLSESSYLLREARYAGCIYLAGRATEGILRALLWRNDAEIRQGRKSLDTGHDLRQVLQRVTDLGVVRNEEHRVKLVYDVQRVAQLWTNNMRFWSTIKVEKHWLKLGEIHARKTLKRAADDFYNANSTIVKRCEVLCKS